MKFWSGVLKETLESDFGVTLDSEFIDSFGRPKPPSVGFLAYFWVL